MQEDARFGVESLQNANAERYGALLEGPVLSEETVNCERYGALRNGNFIVNPILLEESVNGKRYKALLSGNFILDSLLLEKRVNCERSGVFPERRFIPSPPSNGLRCKQNVFSYQDGTLLYTANTIPAILNTQSHYRVKPSCCLVDMQNGIRGHNTLLTLTFPTIFVGLF
jgi:hypothetical protein